MPCTGLMQHDPTTMRSNGLIYWSSRAARPLLEVARDASAGRACSGSGSGCKAHVWPTCQTARFHVLIKDQVLDMNLPPNTQPGEALDLAVIKTEPRLTFAVAADIQRAIGRSPADVRLSDASKVSGQSARSHTLPIRHQAGRAGCAFASSGLGSW